MTRLRVVLRGRVQGVGFRETVLAVAREHPVSGHVRNRSDGTSLEIEAEGDRADVEAFVDDVVRRKPPWSRVDEMERETREPAGGAGFVRLPTV